MTRRESGRNAAAHLCSHGGSLSSRRIDVAGEGVCRVGRGLGCLVCDSGGLLRRSKLLVERLDARLARRLGVGRLCLKGLQLGLRCLEAGLGRRNGRLFCGEGGSRLSGAVAERRHLRRADALDRDARLVS